MTNKLTKQEFVGRIKTKYPEYKDIEDNVLYDKIIAKYPEYKESVIEEAPKESAWQQFRRGLSADLRPGDVAMAKVPEAKKIGLGARPGMMPLPSLAELGFMSGTAGDIAMMSGPRWLHGVKIPKPPGIISRGLGKLASWTTGIPEEQVSKTMKAPSKYTAKPLSAADEVVEFGKAKNKVVKNVDDLFNFRVKTIEDKVAKTVTKYPETKIAVEPIEQVIKNYTDDMVRKGMIDDVPKPVKQLLKTIEQKSRSLYPQMGKSSPRYLAFEDAHRLKQDIYKMIGESYGAENFTDVAANAYKRGAREINTSLRNVPKYGVEYAKANDSVKVIYDLYDDIGTTGERIFKEGGTQKGASRWFRNMFKDPEGRDILRRIEDVLPENQRFMKDLEALEETQTIRKAWKSGGKMESTAIGAGGLGGLGWGIGGPIGGTIGGYAGASLTNPRLLAANLRMAEKAGALTAPAKQILGPTIGLAARKPAITMTVGKDVAKSLSDALKDQKAKEKTLKSAVLE